MKRIISFAFLLLISTSIFAEFEDESRVRIGGGLVFATNINNFGLSFNGVYSITEQWEAGITYNRIFKKNLSAWDIIDFEGHYIFYIRDWKLSVYGLAGLSAILWKVTIPATTGIFATPEVTNTGGNAAFNIGTGIKYELHELLTLQPEMKLSFQEGSFFRIAATVQYRF